METTFITIHDLSLDARIRYSSDSIEDILGYLPGEVTGKSCWEYFHPEEVPFAKANHGRGIELDKAAALFYCKVKHKNGDYIGCECVFTVVYDVLVASTSVYRQGHRSLQRRKEAPLVQRLFSSTPRDPRYHMLSYISSKFSDAPTTASHEPRAAFFLNRFTRTATIMYATNGVASILGVRPERLVGKSFYYCIAEDCLQDAVRCLESAKSNDSIAYLRFWFRDPAVEERDRAANRDSIKSGDEDNEDGGVRLHRHDQAIADAHKHKNDTRSRSRVAEPADPNSRSSSGNGTNVSRNANGSAFDPTPSDQSSGGSSSTSPDEPALESIEVEAVVSCTSDGLVVVLRRARPVFPPFFGKGSPVEYENGLFASPWAMAPTAPLPTHTTGENGVDPLASATITSMAMTTPGPETSTVMAAIREVAVFAWSLTGINGSLVQHGRGRPEGEAVPPDGLPIWDPTSDHPENDQYNGFSDNSHRRTQPDYGEVSSSEDEVVFKRSKVMPEWKRPARRAHRDAFGTEVDSMDAEPGRTPARKRKVER